jgi:hypothetical protein
MRKSDLVGPKERLIRQKYGIPESRQKRAHELLWKTSWADIDKVGEFFWRRESACWHSHVFRSPVGFFGYFLGQAKKYARLVLRKKNMSIGGILDFFPG